MTVAGKGDEVAAGKKEKETAVEQAGQTAAFGAASGEGKPCPAKPGETKPGEATPGATKSGETAIPTGMGDRVEKAVAVVAPLAAAAAASVGSSRPG